MSGVKENSNKTFKQNILFLIVVIIFLLLIGVYLGWFISNGQVLSLQTSDWGTFGDFIGGISNPIIALAVLWFVGKAYFMQKEELCVVKDEMKKQRLISAYSQLLSINISELETCRRSKEKYSDKVSSATRELEDLENQREGAEKESFLRDVEEAERIREQLNEAVYNVEESIRNINRRLNFLDDLAVGYSNKIQLYREKLEELLL